MAAFLLDPASGGGVAYNETKRTQRKQSNMIEVWVTEWEYGVPNYLNNQEHAADAMQSLESRLHSRNQALAAAGVLEYQQTLEQTAGVKREAAIENCDADSSTALIIDHNFDVTTPAKEPRTRGPKISPSNKATQSRGAATSSETPLAIQLKIAKDQFDAVVKTAKTLADKMSRELTELKLVEARLASHAWAEGWLTYHQTCTEAQHDAAIALSDKRLELLGRDFWRA